MTYRIKRSWLGGYSVHYVCPRCNTGLKSPIQDAGESDSCPDCNATFQVPGGTERDQVLKQLADEQQLVQERWNMQRSAWMERQRTKERQKARERRNAKRAKKGKPPIDWTSISDRQARPSGTIPSLPTNRGFVYILLNATMPGLLKIGMTTLTPEERARQLSQETGVPAPFAVAYAEEVPDCRVAESQIHAHLRTYRINDGREFFSLPLRDAIPIVAQIAVQVRDTVFPESALHTAKSGLGALATASPSNPIHMPESSRKASIVVLSVLRKNFKGIKRAYFHPDLPPQKLQNVRKRYAVSLKADEQVLLIYDGTWVGSAANGFICTDQGLGWAQFHHPPNYRSYLTIKPNEIRNGWTGFFVQGRQQADIAISDRERVAVALRESLHGLWKLRI